MPQSVFDFLHYDNATYIFFLALHAGVEPVSYDTATYALPVAATRRRTLYRSCTLTGFELGRCRNRCSTFLHYDNATYIFLLALHAGVEPVRG